MGPAAPKVLVTEPALAGKIERLREQVPGVEVAVMSGFEDEEFVRLAGDAIVLVNLRRRIDARTLADAPRVRLVQQLGVGYDAVDRPAMAAAGVAVAYNPGVNREGVAEHTLMLMLALIKRLPLSERVTDAGRFATGEVVRHGLDDLAGATVGLIGMGDIAREVAARLDAFGSRVVYHTRRPIPDGAAGARAVPLSLPELLAASDIVSLHVPATPETYHLIGDAELAAMRPGSYLINTARGGLVDEDALRRSIEAGHLAGAALDVLEHEMDGRNPFADLPAVIVTPHTAGGSHRSLDGSISRSAANIRRFLAGEPLVDLVPT
jgi:phosphoglycerate dehydrogenase-like enzyme